MDDASGLEALDALLPMMSDAIPRRDAQELSHTPIVVDDDGGAWTLENRDEGGKPPVLTDRDWPSVPAGRREERARGMGETVLEEEVEDPTARVDGEAGREGSWAPSRCSRGTRRLLRGRSVVEPGEADGAVLI